MKKFVYLAIIALLVCALALGACDNADTPPASGGSSQHQTTDTSGNNKTTTTEGTGEEHTDPTDVPSTSEGNTIPTTTAPPPAGGDVSEPPTTDAPSDDKPTDNGSAGTDETDPSDPSVSCQHTFGEWETLKHATCVEEGELVRTCSKCSETEKKQVPPNDEHIPVTDAAVPATCKDTGLSEGSHCSVCDQVLVEQKVTPITDNHTVVIDAAVSATCMSTGLSEGSHCSVCDQVLVEQKVTPITDNHTVVIDAAVPATCKDTGLSEGSHCSLCGKVLTKQTVTAALGHDMAEATCVKPASCKRNCGYTEGDVTKHIIVGGTCTGCHGKTISTVDELKTIAMDGNYILVNDLVLEEEWVPLGTRSKPFSGYFDGNGYTISGLTIKGQYNYYGLFGYNAGTIRNLGIRTVSLSSYVRLSGAMYAGSLVGYNTGTVISCYADQINIRLNTNPDVGVSNGYAGGLIGYNSGYVSDCYSAGTGVAVTSISWMSATYAYAGGLVGSNREGTIINCYSTVDRVSGTYSGSNMHRGSFVGGLIGENNSGEIANCYRSKAQTFMSTVNSTTGYKPTNTDGIEEELAVLQSVRFQMDTLGWTADTWNFTEGAHPGLKRGARVASVA